MRGLRAAIGEVAAPADVGGGDLTPRFGLHWESSPYAGGITTTGRPEVTALGDEVNETARIETCADGGRLHAPKPLIERLDDAAALGRRPDRVTNRILGD